jgi:hypothetical protein
MNLQTLVIIVVASLAIIFAASYLKEFIVKTEGFDGTVPTCTYTAIPIPNAYIPNCSGTAAPFICTGYTTLAEAQTACNSVLGCKGITYRLDTAMGLHYTLRSGYVADPIAPVATTMTSFNGESSYVITNLAVCKPNWQEGAAWQTPEIQKTIAAATPAGSVANAAARAAAGPTIAGVAPGGPGMNSSVGTSTTGVTVPGGTMVLTAATNTLWANSMASQPAPLQGGASVTAAGPGAGAGGV